MRECANLSTFELRIPVSQMTFILFCVAFGMTPAFTLYNTQLTRGTIRCRGEVFTLRGIQCMTDST